MKVMVSDYCSIFRFKGDVVGGLMLAAAVGEGEGKGVG